MRKIVALVLTLSLAAPFTLRANGLKDDPRVVSAIGLLELWLDAQRAYEQIPGISIAVVHDQDIIWSGGFGHSDLEQESPMTSQTIQSICSVSKLFTSIAVMQLRDRGKLRLDDPVSKHLPWFAIQQTHEGAPPVTIHGLLTHSAGLPRESAHPYWSAPDFDFPTREQIIERLASQETLYPADTYYQYSNLGLTLAGQIVEEVSGQKYEDYVRSNILDPLRLQDTRPEMPEQLQGGRLATGYGATSRAGTRSKLPFFQANGVAPAAGYSSTVEDLGRFASWQFRLLDGRGEEVLHSNTLREMHRVNWLDTDWETARGLGFSVWKRDDKTFVGHGGHCPGYRTSLLLQPESKIATVFMANASGVNAGMYTREAYSIVAPAIADALKSPDTAKQPDPALHKLTGTYSVQPWGGEIAVLIWKDQLATVSFPTDNPLQGLSKLKHVEGTTFRRVRDNDELGEEIFFELDSEGKVTRLRRHSNFYPRVR
jgi:CubicO group peptidase (beta-lactamase class C family)